MFTFLVRKCEEVRQFYYVNQMTGPEGSREREDEVWQRMTKAAGQMSLENMLDEIDTPQHTQLEHDGK